jgi:hypothetical protein
VTGLATLETQVICVPWPASLLPIHLSNVASAGAPPIPSWDSCSIEIHRDLLVGHGPRCVGRVELRVLSSPRGSLLLDRLLEKRSLRALLEIVEVSSTAASVEPASSGCDLGGEVPLQARLNHLMCARALNGLLFGVMVCVYHWWFGHVCENLAWETIDEELLRLFVPLRVTGVSGGLFKLGDEL